MCRTRSGLPPIGPLLPTEDFVFDAESPTPLPDLPFPFLSFPPEIRRKVYRLLLRSTVPLYPTIETNPATDRKWNRKPYPRPHIDTSILRVSKQVHAEASAVLYGDNRLVLQFPQNWAVEHNAALPTNYCCCGRRVPYYVRRVCFVPPPRYLRLVHDLIIEVYLLRGIRRITARNRPAFPATRVRKQLVALCEGLGGEHTLVRFELRFRPVAVKNVPNEVLADFESGIKHAPTAADAGVNCFCNLLYGPNYTKHELAHNACRQSAIVDQQVLEPLTKLRGVGQVEVVGRVTDEWAEFLKLAMTGTPGTEMDGSVFEHEIFVKWPKPPTQFVTGRKRKRGKSSRK